MKNIKYILIGVFLLMLGFNPIHAQSVSMSDAEIIAKNWINVIIDETGTWGEYKNAEIESMQEFTRKDRNIGYFFNIEPKGFIIVSLRKELAPVKAYSAASNLNPDTDNEGAEFLKTSMERILDTIVAILGTIENIKSSDLAGILEINYSGSWEQLYNYVPGTWSDFPKKTEPGQDNYQEGEILLEGNNWHQHPPYNDDCPWMNCSNSNGRAVVGCVATAGSQIMHYWNWPPYATVPYNDSYDWPNMPDVADINDPQVVIDALAELNHEVGLAVGMSYGCDGSGAATSNMEGVYEDFRYSTACHCKVRPDYTASDWYDLIKVQLNLNRPIQYRIPGHSIVVDGWQHVGSVYYIRQYHTNYGWTGTGNDAWFTLDAIPGCDPDGDYIVTNIVPVTAMGSWVYGPYNTQTFNYRYFDRDATGYNATFQNGQFLQFLPEVVVTGISSTDPIEFNGSDFLNLRMFTGGDLSHGIRIYDASIQLTNYGSIKFYDE